ncbi:MAG TPA: tetratricopeptide repeat protein [Lysobacter sp.]
MAIDELLDEHEQSERVLDWLRRNGAALIGGILLGLAAIGGWKWWEYRQAQEHAQAATAYQAVLEAIKAKDKAADAKVKALSEGVYRTLALLELAKSQVASDQRDAAIATLRSIKTQDPALAGVVNQRLARLLIDARQADAALKLIADASTASALEIRGDAQLALGQRDRARETYQQALTKAEVGSPHRRLLELKLTEVGGTPVKPEAKS